MKKGYLYIIATAFLFSTAEIASKLVANQINPFQLVFLRFLIGGMFLLPFAIVDIKKRKLKLGVGDFLFFALTGFLGVTVSMSIFQFSLLFSKASAVAVIFSTNTIFTALLAVLILKEKFTKNAALAIALGVAGIASMLYPFALGNDLAGLALSLAAAVTFALYGIVGTKRVAKYGGFILNSFSFLAGVLLTLPIMGLAHTPLVSGINSGNIFVVIYYGIVVTGIGYFCYLTAMKETSAIETSAVFFIKPALAPALALLVLGDAIKTNVLFGIVFIAAGAFIMFWKRLRSVKNP